MEERKITISLEEYKKLIEKAERIAAVKRFTDCMEYPSVTEIKIILGIEKENENETV